MVVASAETNTLRGVGVGASDRVILLHSDTPEGSFCSSRLCEFLSDFVKCRSSKERSLKALSYHHASFAQTGTIAVRFGSEGNFLPLRLETSARGEAQTELVLEYLRHRVV